MSCFLRPYPYLRFYFFMLAKEQVLLKHINPNLLCTQYLKAGIQQSHSRMHLYSLGTAKCHVQKSMQTANEKSDQAKIESPKVLLISS